MGDSKSDQMYLEQKKLPYDKKTLFRGKVVDKNARWNLCYSDFEQEPDLENGKGTVVAFSNGNDENNYFIIFFFFFFFFIFFKFLF